jgi:hypothetical protein
MVTLSYPYPTPTHSVSLPNPILGDANQKDADFILNYAGTGRIYTYKKSLPRNKLLLTFVDLTFTQRANLKLFLYRAVNGLSGYLDHLSVQWQGVFMNDPFEQVESHLQYGEITLEFRGRKI